MIHDIELDEVNYLEIDGVRCVSFSFVAGHAGRVARGDYRYWQAFYNILHACGQSGMPDPWPELFYKEDQAAGHDEFHRKMDVIDDFIFPRSGPANVMAFPSPSGPSPELVAA